MKSLPDRFSDNLNSLGIKSRGTKFLLAISGGLDSMVMLHLCYRLGLDCRIAHCNFGLRGDDSDGDESFVKQAAATYRFPFHSRRFSTLEFSRQQGISVQMAARDLRYTWFHELAEEFSIDYIAVAHHADDVAETILLNLVRGTGLTGMQGIRNIRAKVVRPLLFATRADLESWAEKNKLEWRNDASNDENYYKRNLIRNKVFPLLKEINPSVNLTMTRHAQIMDGYEKILSEYISGLEPGLTRVLFDGMIRSILLEKLLATAAPATVLYQLLKPYGIPANYCLEILDSGTGAEFYFDGFRLVRDRNEITLFAPGVSEEQEYEMAESESPLQLRFGTLTMETSDLSREQDYSQLPGFGDKSVAFVDASTVRPPLVVRRWRAGDRFQPLGMQGTRLLSDYFTDEKFSSAMKEIVYLLLSENRVVWIAGHRVGEPFRLHKETTHMTRFTFHSNS